MGEEETYLGPIGRREGWQGFQRASGERRKGVTKRAGFGITFVRMPVVVDVDELTMLVDVCDRMLERALPAGKQSDREPEARYAFPEEACPPLLHRRSTIAPARWTPGLLRERSRSRAA
jgi:hypothetical protein